MNAADGVCLGFGFVPQLDLAQALGCELAYDEKAATHAVAVDPTMRTSQAGIYAAGEVTGMTTPAAASPSGARDKSSGFLE